MVSSQVYEIIKTIYSSADSSVSEATRVSVLQNTLGQLRLANIATLDAVTTHFTRLIDLTSADEAYVSSLAQILAPCILRPRLESSLTTHERHAYRLVRDLFQHKEEIFGELKRASSQNMSLHVAAQQRVRAPSSTDESNRRANMEARNRAIASRSRASSPAPAALGANGRSHRRDRSVGGAEKRFPVVSSPTATADSHRTRVRQSLDVPDSVPGTPQNDTPATSNSQNVNPMDGPTANGSPHDAATITSPEEIHKPDEQVGIEKKNSLTRSGHVAATANRLNRKGPGTGSGSGSGGGSGPGRLARSAVKRDSAASLREEKGHGVELSDKPMDF